MHYLKHIVLTLIGVGLLGGATGLAFAHGPRGPGDVLVETKAGDHRLAIGGGCWTYPDASGALVPRCALVLPPNRKKLAAYPRLRTQLGETIKFRLAYVPDRFTLKVNRVVGSKAGRLIFRTQEYRLTPKRVVAWKVRGHGGYLQVMLKTELGDPQFRGLLQVGKENPLP